MDRLPPNPLISRALEIAEKRIGIEELAHRLNASDTTVRVWRGGHIKMPKRKFLPLVDVLADLGLSWTEWDQTSGEST